MNASRWLSQWVGVLRAESVLGTALCLSATVLLTASLKPARAIDQQEAKITTQGQQAMAADGVYLLGEVNRPGQFGSSYFIFLKSGAQVVGAIYYPQSEYTCFVGQKLSTVLNLNLVGSGDSPETQVAVPLQSMHTISNIGSAETQVLNHCREEIAQVVNSKISKQKAAFETPFSKNLIPSIRDLAAQSK